MEHALDEVFELLREVGLFTWLVLAVGSPENVSSVGGQASVEGIVWLSSGEWWVLSDHDEENDGRGEQIYRFSFVWLFKMDFWGHVV